VDAGPGTRVVSAPHTTTLLQLRGPDPGNRPAQRRDGVRPTATCGAATCAGGRHLHCLDRLVLAPAPAIRRDLGELRMRWVISTASKRARSCLDGWQGETGREATNVATGRSRRLNTPVEHGWLASLRRSRHPLDQQGVIDRATPSSPHSTGLYGWRHHAGRRRLLAIGTWCPCRPSTGHE